MSHINTIDGLIAALGGDTVVAADLDISQPAVANWKMRGEIPNGWHLRLVARCVDRGLSVDPVVFGLSQTEAAALNKLLSKARGHVAA